MAMFAGYRRMGNLKDQELAYGLFIDGYMPNFWKVCLALKSAKTTRLTYGNGNDNNKYYVDWTQYCCFTFSLIKKNYGKKLCFSLEK